MNLNRKRIGSWGEELAAEKLRSEGYVILEQNYRTPYGELDLVARRADLVIFVEVKTRTSRSFAQPEDSITRRKRGHILQSIDYYLQNHPDIECDWRVDVAAIQGRPGSSEAEMTWFENALV
jgi:putative endonuclease